MIQICLVESMQVVLKRWDGARIWYPNQMINSNTIVNVTRTDTRCQCFKVCDQCAPRPHLPPFGAPRHSVSCYRFAVRMNWALEHWAHEC